MAQQIKKKFIQNNAIDGDKIKLLKDQILRGENQANEEVDLLKLNAEDKALILGQEVAYKSDLESEAEAREQGDIDTLQDAKDYTDQKVADLVDSAPEVLDTLKELADALGGDENFAVTIAGQLGSLDDRVDALESEEEVIENDDLASFPAVGEESKIYIAKDTNKIYRYSILNGGSLTFDKVVGSGEAYTTLQDALAAASDGENILVKDGTYSVDSTINVTKQVKIVGESVDGVIFQTAGTTSDPVTMFNVSVDNVALAKLTIKHRKTSNTSVETAVVASGGGFPQTRIKNFILEQCKIEFAEFALTVRAENWCARDSVFTYATGTVSNSCRAIGIYGNKGEGFIYNNVLKNDVLNGTAFRPFYLTSTTGTNPNETVEGKLVVEGTTQLGPLAQFFNQDNQQSVGAGTFELQIKNNVINESNLFAGFAAAVANSGNMFSSITLSGNTLSNFHAADGGKGVFGVYGTAAFRSSDLIVHAENNILGQEVYRSGWGPVDGSLIGKETATPLFTVSKDSVISSSGSIPTALSAGSSGEYIELSADTDLSGVEQQIDDLINFAYENTVYVSKNGLDTNEGKQHSPFLTITAALDSITDATPSKRYVVKIASGAYTEASLALKANVFLFGENKEAVRISGNVSLGPSFTAGSSFDNRSGASNLTLLNAADFNWNTVQSAAGKLYFNEVVFGSTLNLYGYNNAIAQAQFNACVIFGNFTISGINVGVFTNNVCFSNITLNQHPNGGMATILSAAGGYCGGNITQTASINDFNRRCSTFLRNFSSENLIVDGPASYADYTIDSGSKQGAQSLNGGNLVPMNAVISHRIAPNVSNTHNMGDWGKQWFWNFGYVHASTGTDLFLISYPSSFGPDSSGKSIGIYADGAGLQTNANGGDIALATAATSGTGIRGKISLDGREIDVTSKQIKNLANGSDATDAVNKQQLDAIVQFNKETKTVDSTIISNGYVDLAFEAKPKSIVMFVDRLGLHEGYDYSVSVVGGVTRITFLSTLLTPSQTALEEGDILNFTYAK